MQFFFLLNSGSKKLCVYAFIDIKFLIWLSFIIYDSP